MGDYQYFRLNRRRWECGPRNPLADPIGHVKQPLLTQARGRGRAVVEFDRFDVAHLRAKFGATQREFARLIGVSRHTLRNWEKGRRRPHGPARALLRAIDADPIALARVLRFYRQNGPPEPEDWTDS
jgi:putative transcriptional regulator